MGVMELVGKASDTLLVRLLDLKRKGILRSLVVNVIPSKRGASARSSRVCAKRFRYGAAKRIAAVDPSFGSPGLRLTGSFAQMTF